MWENHFKSIVPVFKYYCFRSLIQEKLHGLFTHTSKKKKITFILSWARTIKYNKIEVIYVSIKPLQDGWYDSCFPLLASCITIKKEFSSVAITSKL